MIYTSVFPGQEVGRRQCVRIILAEVRVDGTSSAVMAVNQVTRDIFSGRISGNHAASVVSSKRSRQQTALSTTV